MSSPQPGETIGGKYRILRTVGEGGMGAVFEAENTVISCRVAIKWLHAGHPLRSYGVDRLLREARAAARVRHPNVVDIYDIGYEGESVFLVMELLRGQTLAGLLERRQVPVSTLIAILIPAMRGAAEAHRRGVVHRDIKPENIFLARELDRDEPVPKVLDFGIAKVEDVGGGTLPGYTLGTPQFMSLEQLRAARDLDARADVYGFGVILYLALTGQVPFRAENLADLVITITTTKPVPPHELAPELPRALSDVVMRAIAVDRDERTANLTQLVRELAPFAASAPPLVARVEREGEIRWETEHDELGAGAASGSTFLLTPAVHGRVGEPPRVQAAATTASATRVLADRREPTPYAPLRRWSLAVGSGAALGLVLLMGISRMQHEPQAEAAVAQPPVQNPPPSPTPSAALAAATVEPTTSSQAEPPAATDDAAADAGLEPDAPSIGPSAAPTAAAQAPAGAPRPWGAGQGGKSTGQQTLPGAGARPQNRWATAAGAKSVVATTQPLGGQLSAPPPAPAPPSTKDLTVSDAGAGKEKLRVCEFLGSCPP